MHRRDDRHLHPLAIGERLGALGRGDTFGHGVTPLQHVAERGPAADLETDRPVPRERARAGEDEIAETRQTREGRGIGPEVHPEAGHLGKPARDVPEGIALDYVAGYTVLNDVSAREFQFDVPLAMTSFAKGMDGFCPMGPWIVTPEEVGEPWMLDVKCWLNGEEVQHGNTRDLIFSVSALIAFLSRYMTLEPGDVIATGTPAGVGHFRDPPRYLKPGDRLRLEVERVGVLEHAIG